jgi:hypothetical protein
LEPVANNAQVAGMSGTDPAGVPFIPYGRQEIDDDDIAEVVAALRSQWLTTGPRVAEFERAFAAKAGHRMALPSIVERLRYTAPSTRSEWRLETRLSCRR